MWWTKSVSLMAFLTATAVSAVFVPIYYANQPGMIQGCQMAKFDPFRSLDWARVEGEGAQSKERKGSNLAA